MPGQAQPPERKPKLPFLARTSAMGSSGWEAYTVGFTLVGCIIAGAGVGWLLDRQFETEFWLPIGFLIGVVAGFREMWIVLKRLQAQQDRARREARERATKTAYTPPRPDDPPTDVEKPKRLFAVPPPPLEGYKQPTEPHDEPETTEEILRRLLADSDEDDLNETNDEKSNDQTR